MENPSTRELYTRYVRAIEFTNSQVSAQCSREQRRAVFRVRTVSESEFDTWWQNVTCDSNCMSRWLERLQDPAVAFTRAQERINSALDPILNRQRAA